MGFSVLLNNIRGVGYSENTTAGITTWGYAYHFDLLGAWDYLKQDPDSILGGQLPASKVGIMGFSMGAFITLNAFHSGQKCACCMGRLTTSHLEQRFLLWRG